VLPSSMFVTAVDGHQANRVRLVGDHAQRPDCSSPVERALRARNASNRSMSIRRGSGLQPFV
jgi:hypothetical protein